MDLQGVEHALPGDDDLLGLLFHRQGPNQSCYLLRCLPLGQLQKTTRVKHNIGENTQSWNKVSEETLSVSKKHIAVCWSGISFILIFCLSTNNQELTCPRRFCPAHTDVWMIFRKSCPVLGLKMKIAPLIGLVVKLPSNVCKESETLHKI